MKYKYIILLLFLIPFFVLSQTREVRPKYAPRKDKHKNASDAKGKQGTWKEYTRNHDLLFEENYENNIKNGPCTRYFTTTGGVREELNYYYGIREGDYKSYFYTGNLKNEGSYKKNRRNEHWVFYHLGTGEKSSEGDYNNGKKNGEWIFYNRKGEMISKGNYVNDRKDGTWNSYDIDGKVISSQNFSKSAMADENPTINKATNKNTLSSKPSKNSSVSNKKVIENKSNPFKFPSKNQTVAKQDLKKVTPQAQTQTPPTSSAAVVPKIQIDSTDKK